MVTDLIADLLTRIRNAQRAGHKSVKVRSSNVCRSVLDVLVKEGFVEGYQACENVRGQVAHAEVFLKYYRPYEPLISEAKRVSKSGRRSYVGADEIPTVARGLGICIVSTSQGVMSDREARKRKIGGELVAMIS